MGKCRAYGIGAALLVCLEACGGGGGSSSGDTGLGGMTGTGSTGAEPQIQYNSLAAQIPDTGQFLHLGNSALWGQTLPVRLAGVQMRNGVVEGVRGGADVTLVDATTLDVQLGGDVIRFTYNAQTFRFEDGAGRWFNTPQPPFALTLNDPTGGGLFHLAGGFEPVTLPGGLVRYTGTSELLIVPDGTASLSGVRSAAGQVDISVDFANGMFAGEGFSGQADLSGTGAQNLVVAVSGTVAGDVLTGGVDTVSVTSGAYQVNVVSSELGAQVLENGAAKLVGDFGVDYATTGGAAEQGVVVGSFRGFK